MATAALAQRRRQLPCQEGGKSNVLTASRQDSKGCARPARHFHCAQDASQMLLLHRFIVVVKRTFHSSQAWQRNSIVRQLEAQWKTGLHWGVQTAQKPSVDNSEYLILIPLANGSEILKKSHHSSFILSDLSVFEALQAICTQFRLTDWLSKVTNAARYNRSMVKAYCQYDKLVRGGHR